MGAIIKVEHLSHRYSVQWAIKDINIEIPRKGIYGLLGSNGAGKSTLMNSIGGKDLHRFGGNRRESDISEIEDRVLAATAARVRGFERV